MMIALHVPRAAVRMMTMTPSSAAAAADFSVAEAEVRAAEAVDFLAEAAPAVVAGFRAVVAAPVAAEADFKEII